MSRSAASRMGNVLSVVLCIMLLLSIAANAIAQEQSVLIWINDMGKRDSQFGYYDGLAAQSLDPVFVEYDFEGLACLHKTLYATSAMDGQRPSQLYTVAIDRDTNQATITLVGTIQNAQQEPFFEVAALAEKADGTLWGFAGVKDRRGLLKIDPVTAIAELVLPSKLGIEGIEWLGDTLWLVANGKFYTWTIDGALTFAFQVTDDIEGLDVVDGLLWGGLHDDPRGLVAIDPTTGVVVSEPGLTAGDDIESLTFCPLQPSASPTATPTAIQTSTPTSTPTERPVIIVTEMATGLPTMTATPTSTLTPTLTPTLTLTPTPTATASPTPTLLVLPTKVTAEPPTPQPPTNEMPVDEPMTPNRYLTYLPLVNTTP